MNESTRAQTDLNALLDHGIHCDGALGPRHVLMH